VGWSRCSPKSGRAAAPPPGRGEDALDGESGDFVAHQVEEVAHADGLPS
jgi:hypothetical protein